MMERPTGRVLRYLWERACPRLPPGERLQLAGIDPCISGADDAWELRAERYSVDRDGLPLRGTYRYVVTSIPVRAWMRTGLLIDLIQEAMRQLVSLLWDKFPKGWRRFERRADKKACRTRLFWRYA